MLTIVCDTETEAKTNRRECINEGYEVSLIGLNPANGKYEFDVIS